MKFIINFTNNFNLINGSNFVIHRYSNNYGFQIDRMGNVEIGIFGTLDEFPAKLYINSTDGGTGLNVEGGSMAPYLCRIGITSSGSTPLDIRRSGTQIFYVSGTGNVWCTGNYTFSDRSLKSNIETIPGSLDKVLKLRGVTFNINAPDDDEEIDFETAYQIAQSRTPGITKELFTQIQEEKSGKRMGVIAQEVEKILPEVVRTSEDGLKAVAYSEMVGLLIEAIKEQQTQINELKAEVDELKGDNASLRSSATETGTMGLSNPSVSACKLYQNAPNPFSQTTQIKYYLPESVKIASLNIYNLQGKQLKQIVLNQRGESSQLISGSEFEPGIYLYALIADGQEVDVKRMILTE
jgi:hypothetical protein